MERKEAIKIIKSHYPVNKQIINEALEVLIPELIESEDEKVRKEIISFLQDHIDDINLQVSGDYDTRDKEDIALQEWCKRAIAWLEKQKEPELSEGFGEYITELSKQFPEVSFAKLSRIAVRVKNWLEKQGKEISWKPSKEEMDVLYGLAYITNQYDEHKEEVITRLYQDLKREFFNGSSYENMFPNTEDGVRRRSTIQVLEYARSLDNYNQYGKADIDKNIAWLEKQGYTKKDVDDAYLKGICDAKHELEKQGEQESADKHEPKFKNGQWIVWQNKCYKVNYNGCGYGLIDQNGLSTSLEYGTVDKSASAFTIQDAKDGDVLQLGVVTVIFQEYIDNVNCKCYCSVCNGEFEIPTKDESYGTFNATPATKEQSDLLFQKMKEAGYEWNSEKKELKKISQRTISAEAKEALYDKPTDEEMKELLRTEYEKGRADAIAEMKSSWSEEDKKKLNSIYQLIAEAADEHAFSTTCRLIGDKECVELQDFLKSLIDRVQPQPKQEWSEKDEKILNNLIDYIKVDDALQYSEKQVVDWLKSLKQRKLIGG